MKRASTMPTHIAVTKMNAGAEPKPSAVSAGPGQKPHSPPDAKDRGTLDSSGVDVCPRRYTKARGEEWVRKPQHTIKSDKGHIRRIWMTDNTSFHVCRAGLIRVRL
jgi:hypothetical protein